MDKETLSNYGWIVICVLVLAVLLALATPFGTFVSDAVKTTTQGLFDTNLNALDSVNIETDDLKFDSSNKSSPPEINTTIPEGGTYYVGVTSIKLGDYTGATSIYNTGDTFPENFVPVNGDVFVYGDYEYRYNSYYALDYDYSWVLDNAQNGWGVHVLKTNQTTYSEIVNSIANKPVTNLYCTFFGCNKMTTTPILPPNITHMFDTFGDCTSLTTISKIPINVIDMSYTFNYCTSLTTAPTIPNKVTNMEGTFNNCTSLTTPPDMNKAINITNMSSTFSECTFLKTAPILPNSVINLSYAFYNCTSLETAPTIPHTVTDIGYTFQGCEAMTTPPPTIPNSITSMVYTFHNCKSLTGTIEINANPSIMESGNCFYGVDFENQNLNFIGTSLMLDKLGLTGTNYCTNCNGKCLNNHYK